MKDYDHKRYGPFLGVSDEGSAAATIREAAYESPKCRAIASRMTLSPAVVGVALDAERLGGVGEVAVGPNEYAEVWTGTVDRILITTNIGTRVNLRVYRREPRVQLLSDSRKAIEEAKEAISSAFIPFIRTPDSRPRPLTVFINIPSSVKMSRRKKAKILRELVQYVSSGEAAGMKICPAGHTLGLAAWVSSRRRRDDVFDAIDLAADADMKLVILDGSKRKAAREALSLAGLLEYFKPGLVGPILRRAKQKGVAVRGANVPDTDTIARSTWSGLHTARAMGVHLGKYGCFPLTLDETERVVASVQKWFKDWSAAPAFFLDQGLLREGAIDVERDLPRGIELWLDTVARHGVRVVLLDTIDKASGRRLLKKSARDNGGFLGWRQIARIQRHAQILGVKVLWAGGLSLQDAFEMGKLGVFGMYVTSAVADTIAVPEDYKQDPMLPSLKEPSHDAVLRVKMVLEAGFLLSRLTPTVGEQIKASAKDLIQAVETKNKSTISKRTDVLFAACLAGWRIFWKSKNPRRSGAEYNLP